MQLRPFLARVGLAAVAVALATVLHARIDLAETALAGPTDELVEAAGGDPEQELTPEELAALEAFVKRFHEAQRLMGNGKDEDAAALLGELLAERPDVPQAHHLLAVVRQFQGRHAEARESFAAAARLAPADGVIQRDAGLDQLRGGDPRLAAEYFERAAKAYAEDVDTWVGLGTSRRLLGEIPAAVIAYRRALEVQTGSVDARVGLATCIHDEAPEEALELLERLPDTFSDVCLARTQAHFAAGQHDLAVKAARRAVERAVPGPGGIPYLSGATRELLDHGAWEAARDAALVWVERDRREDRPGVAASFALSQAHAALGDAEAALAGLTASSPPKNAAEMDQLDLYRAALLLHQGKRDAADKLLALIADSAADGFARAAARGLLGREPFEKLGERFTDARAGNDVAFVHALTAVRAGDAEEGLRRLRAAAELCEPPGEFPGPVIALFLAD